MPYFILRREIFGLGFEEKRLCPSDKVEGQIGDTPTRLEVIENNKVTLNNIIREGPEGAVIFDKPSRFSTQIGVVHLEELESMMLTTKGEIAKKYGSPGIHQDRLSGLWIRLEEQVGRREPGQRSLSEKIVNVLTLGVRENI